MSDKPSERAAKAVQLAIVSSTPSMSDLAAIIARETGCDANADIVRRLVELCESDQTNTREWDQLYHDAKAALRAAGGKDNGTD